jgi:phosphopentomutase
MSAFERCVIVVLDGVGVGPMPDAGAYGDADRDTLGHVAERRGLRVPNLTRFGLANIRPLAGLAAAPRPTGAYGKAALLSTGKDTTTGHWEIAGIVLERAFPTYPHGFPREVIEKFELATGRKTLGNIPASGTQIIDQLGAEHLKTGRLIVYTSADSVFQIAAHEEIIPIDDLYRICRIAREILQGEHRVGRVIARPFLGRPGTFFRTEHRHDFAVEPPKPTLLDLLKAAGLEVVGVGKIPDIFLNRGITRSLPGKDNRQALESTAAQLRAPGRGLVFTNLVDFDMLYGHRLDIEGYGRAIEELDAMLPFLEGALRTGDLLILTADHGCDPQGPSTDHSREFVPILAIGPGVQSGVNLGARSTLADIGATVAENFGLRLPAGASFLAEIRKRLPDSHVSGS